MYSIGELSKLTGLPISTLRYYDQMGVLVPEHRKKDTGYRYYSDQQLIQVQLIKNMKMLNMPLPDIRNMLLRKDLSYMREKVADSKKHVEQQLQAVNQVDAYLSQGGDLLDLFLDEGLDALHRTYPIGIRTFVETWVLCQRLRGLPNDHSFFTESCLQIQKSRDDQGYMQSGALILQPQDTSDLQFLCGEGPSTFELCMPIHLPKGDPCNNLRHFPALQVASIVCVGGYETPLTTYNLLTRWISANGYRILGPVILQYLLEPCDTMDNDQYIMRLNLPVEKDNS